MNPPPVPIESILGRWQEQRWRGFAVAAIGVAAALFLAITLPAEAPAPPEHLMLRVIDVTGSAGPGSDTYSEFNLSGEPEALSVP